MVTPIKCVVSIEDEKRLKETYSKCKLSSGLFFSLPQCKSTFLAVGLKRRGQHFTVMCSR